ncbi:hypothetical protein SISSUDRAFT_1036646 [Sistotremastrum suecicum HHB10207 ss-3]|uniref:C2 domain-containing protein n=1 Tax=Sistotremastrum suecicum HHB10207 ss-3 TaxID=1314776 RepID=A0A165Z5V3_9AGAM|nr:hypothetical protein SISSUDRAFT_1036646 [Sistotremastrum suecicum HHB10207 ss-3]
MASRKSLGTLVVVVLKARNLIDNHSLYKQDPYTVVRFQGAGKHTDVDVKGGQHPLWDEELHFDVRPPTSDGERLLKVSCFSKESKVDQPLGEGQVDVAETLKTGEFDDWIPLSIDGNQRGEVYIEMTFFPTATTIQRRPTKMPQHDRISRPPPTPPKDKTSPASSASNSPRPTPHRNPSPLPQPNSRYNQQPFLSVPGTAPQMPEPTHHAPPVQPIPAALRPGPAHHIHPTQPAAPAPEHPVKPSNAPPPKLPPRQNPPPPSHPSSSLPNPFDYPPTLPPRGPSPSSLDDRTRRKQQEEADARYAASLAQAEGIDLERLRAEEADAELARRVAQDEGPGQVPGGWVP